MKTSHILKRILKLSYLSLALIPLTKENINSILIIVCVGLTLIFKLKFKERFQFDKQLLYLSLPFWTILLYNIFTFDFSLKMVLLYLPFLVFPLLLKNKPDCIEHKLFVSSVKVFQCSLIVHLTISFIMYLGAYNIYDMFKVSPENIPFFRSFFYHENFLEIHPTYFSMFLLLSASISIRSFFKKEISSKHKMFSMLNSILCFFVILLLSSKMVILTTGFTVFFMLSTNFRSLDKTQLRFALISFGLITITFSFIFKDVVGERFKEIKTEYKKPIEGLYFNSTNVRVAIIKCSMGLISEVPVLGYGNSLQADLNKCYRAKYNSDFYLRGGYNTHNYYMHLLLYGGFLFFIVFIVYICNLFNKLKGSYIGLLFLVQILIINLTENFLGRHYGIVFFTYFISIYYFSINKKNG